MSEKIEKSNFLEHSDYSKSAPVMKKARICALSFFEEYQKQEEDAKGCGNLLINWTKDCLWGLIVKESLPLFEEVWDFLNSNNYTQKNKFTYNYSMTTWVEYPKEDTRKVFVIKTSSEDRTYLFVRNQNKCANILSNFKVVKVWPRQINRKIHMKFNDDRDIEKPSLKTYRKRNFYFGYNDCRDKGHYLFYKDFYERLENSYWHEKEIIDILWYLNITHEKIKKER